MALGQGLQVCVVSAPSRPVPIPGRATNTLAAQLSARTPPCPALPQAVAITLFNNGAATPKRMGRWGSADAAGIRAGVDNLYANGGTNFQVCT